MCGRLTDEQLRAVERALEGRNVRVRAVPGAGKTFTCLRMAAELEVRGKRVLQLTYSCALKNEWRRKRPATGDGPLSRPHSFHSFACALHELVPGAGGRRPCNDDALEAMLASEPPALEARHIADVILVDETQDLTPLYARLLRWYGRACRARFQIVVVGQERQAVYKDGTGGNTPLERRADVRYLTTDDAFGDLLRTSGWCECPFTVSFRLTNVNARTINSLFDTCIEGGNRVDRGCQPIWYCANMFHFAQIAALVKAFIDEYGIGGVQLVAPSWGRENSGIATRGVRNALGEMGYLFAESSSAVTEGKLVTYTCSGSKGTEGLCDIILGADSFAWYVNEESKFVAMTRAREQLVCIQHHQNLPWIGGDSPRDMERHGFDVRIVDEFRPKRQDAFSRTLTVSDLDRSCASLRDLVASHCDFETVVESEGPLEMPQTVSFSSHEEDLNVLQGIFIPFEFARRQTGAAPGFYDIFRPIVVTDRDRGQSAIDAVVGDIPCCDALKRALSAARPPTERKIRDAIEDHLRRHDMEAEADRLVTKARYDELFPSQMLEGLRELSRRPIGTWNAAESANAAIAGHVFRRDHWMLRQVMNYEWATAYEHVATECHERMRSVLGAYTQATFEVPATFRLVAAMDAPAGSPMRAAGLFGRIDCVVRRGAGGRATIVEFKFKRGDLEANDRLQLFLYMCIWAARHPDEPLPDGILHNARTNETCRATLRPSAAPDEILTRAIKTHLGV